MSHNQDKRALLTELAEELENSTDDVMYVRKKGIDVYDLAARNVGNEKTRYIRSLAEDIVLYNLVEEYIDKLDALSADIRGKWEGLGERLEDDVKYDGGYTGRGGPDQDDIAAEWASAYKATWAKKLAILDDAPALPTVAHFGRRPRRHSSFAAPHRRGVFPWRSVGFYPRRRPLPYHRRRYPRGLFPFVGRGVIGALQLAQLAYLYQLYGHYGIPYVYHALHAPEFERVRASMPRARQEVLQQKGAQLLRDATDDDVKAVYDAQPALHSSVQLEDLEGAADE